MNRKRKHYIRTALSMLLSIALLSGNSITFNYRAYGQEIKAYEDSVSADPLGKSDSGIESDSVENQALNATTETKSKYLSIADANGSTISFRINYPGAVVFNGKTHVSTTAKKTKSNYCDVNVNASSSILNYSTPTYKFVKSKNVTKNDTTAYFYVTLKGNKGITKAQKKNISKANKELKKKASRCYFNVLPLDVTDIDDDKITIVFNKKGTAVKKLTIETDAGKLNPANKKGYVFKKDNGSYIITMKGNYAGILSNKDCIVNFETNRITGIESQTVKLGKRISAPTNMDYGNHQFIGWYLDSALTELFDFSKPITGDTTLYAKWGKNNINLADIYKLEETGAVDAIYDDNGDIRTIDGTLTKEKLTSSSDVANLLNDSSELFNPKQTSYRYQFNVNEADIEKQTVEMDGTSDIQSESFYRYTPRVNEIPVLGSQIIVSTKNDGAMTGMYSSYDMEINNTNITPSITADNAINVVLDDLISRSALQGYIDAGTLTREEIAENSGLQANLLIYAANKTIKPALVYEVAVSGETEDQTESTYDQSNNEFIDNERMADNEADSFQDKDSESIAESESAIDTDADTEEAMLTVVSSNMAQVETKDYDEEEITNVDSLDTITGRDIREYFITLFGGENYYIYANGTDSGKVLLKTSDKGEADIEMTSADNLNKIRTYDGDLTAGVYSLRDRIRGIDTIVSAVKPGSLSGNEYSLTEKVAEATSPENMNSIAVSAHANMEKVYDFYKNVLGRRSYNGFGKKIIVVCNYYDPGYQQQQGFWVSNMKLFKFQSDTPGGISKYARTLDIMGHEFTHAVVDYVVGGFFNHSGLTYQGESGALDEAYADIMGSIIEGKTGDQRWQMGEDRELVWPSDNLDENNNFMPCTRDLSATLKRPGYKYNYKDVVPNYSNDNGGVHYYSTIFSHAAYLMMTNPATQGISEETWAKVFYHSMFKLPSDAKFLDARGTVLSTAKAFGFDGQQQQAIKDAFDQVGIKEPNEIRIILTWGATPRDLDSHLVGPVVTSPEDRFHISYSNRTSYIDGAYYSNNSNKDKIAADLDYDDTTSYGPEITTIHVPVKGEYYFYVHDFSNGSSETSTAMALSGAKVEVYYDDKKLQHSFTVDTSSAGTYWSVFSLSIGENNAITVTPINEYGAKAAYT